MRPRFRGENGNLTNSYNEKPKHTGAAKNDAAWRLLKATAHPKCVQVDASLQSPAPEILDYLARHPDAQDTIEGILHWWVLDTCIRNWAPKITETVAQLVERGFLEQESSSDGHVFYRASTQYLATLQSHSPADS